jgi:hypothetical protein
MDLEKINECLLFFHNYVKARKSAATVLPTAAEFEEHSSKFYLEVFSDAVFRRWVAMKYPFLSEGDYTSILAEVCADIITRDEPEPLHFVHENKFRGYLKISFSGKLIDRYIEEGKFIPKELKVKTEEEENKTEEENGEGENESEGESTSVFDIENVGDPDGKNKEDVMLMEVDLSRFPETVAYLLFCIYKSFTEEDDAYKTIERKIAWQIDGKYFEMTGEKITEHEDEVFKKHDYLTIVRYEHWHTVK